MDLEADADEENGWERFDPDDDIQRVTIRYAER